jgi:hypothetical protein
MKDLKRPLRLLILTSSGGGGLLQTALAKEQEVLAAHPDTVIVRRDVLRDWMGSLLGRWAAEAWNIPQKRGNLWIQNLWGRLQPIFDTVMFPWIFCCALRTFILEKIDRVMDTQPLVTSAMIKALRLYNYLENRSIVLEKVLVDLPTKKATHFFLPIQRLSRQDRLRMALITIKPLLEEGETEALFWMQHCRLPMEQIIYERPYVRQAFRHCKDTADPPSHLELEFTTEQERLLWERLPYLQKEATYSKGRRSLSIPIPQHAFVVTVLLGSQPSKIATFRYVEEWVKIFQQWFQRPSYLFVFCEEVGSKHAALFEKLINYLQHQKLEIGFIRVVPFAFQPDRVIAPLFSRSDITITRSGGQTAMELISVQPRHIWIHSEARQLSPLKEPSRRELLQGIPVWESESAVYLEKLYGARLVTPFLLRQRVEEYVVPKEREHPYSAVL